jgi:hypothetical protein
MDFADFYHGTNVGAGSRTQGGVEGGGGGREGGGVFSVCFGLWNGRESMIGTPPITELDPQHGIPFYWWSKNQILPVVVVVCFPCFFNFRPIQAL